MGRRQDRLKQAPDRAPDRPAKICATCGRPFTWRKKWERCWEQVRYCSDRCRASRKSTQ